MSVLIYLDLPHGMLKKQQEEILSYGSALAQQLGTQANVLVCGNPDYPMSQLRQYGPHQVIHFPHQKNGDTVGLSQLIEEQCKETAATVLIFASTLTGKTLAPVMAARLQAGLVGGVIGLPNTTNGFVVKKSVFSAKALAQINISSPLKIIVLQNNTFTIQKIEAVAIVIQKEASLPPSKVQRISVETQSNAIALGEASLVVSGGRGMKGPENWGLIEELAQAMGAATACSRPVADEHWRPHYEHVGQTGGTISPNLYFAVGISGAIQHLAGVNRSKVIVVINKDPEAPFFKVADYGIVGDALELLPKITAAVKKIKA